MNPVIVMTHSSKIESNDASLVHKPFIKIEPLTFNQTLLSVHYDWIIFSSKNAVKYFKPYLSQSHFKQVAVIGKKTAAYCEKEGIEVDFYPADYSQEGFLAECPIHAEENVLIPSSKAARPYLVEQLRECGITVQKIDLYQPQPDLENIKAVVQLIENNEVAAVTFASSSAVRYFFDYLDGKSLQFHRYIVIGKQTLQTIQQYGQSAIQSDEPTIDAMIQKAKEGKQNNGF
ncbi:uroporphyrinogen-III synthase [Staphylococcus auricularis]|uniref:Uroporphyrinogen-III synthase n=1 Tax=Staphylococcus auricularis TaxID=29379 RepID=A0AAP8TTI3_9STAP|nr:uroporphyrinogen-III synthase [Staphylococcus auricularis]MBM0868068.1 uroporphyrinogen-III synthase [Staphylococcus auricularis]MCG7340934.1 uroporphyrinogen-III synthase [Staphylococcus auricularis]MDC6326887.1 uroporphyrinogen-III synthase [Staphylococcus auricularis]MDN4532764.1 uroporphyrinogen-III synthase [Staphylococcus auricularis]PNZ68230.1 uroporphyrinogen III synthase [Staphylococcus auricularis]